MSGDDEKPSWTERDKLSFSELDRVRRERRDGRERRPRSEKARQRTAEATKQYLKEIDTLFAKDPAGEEGERLAKAMRDAHGTPRLAEACRAYRDALGVPDDPKQISLFLDSGDAELVVAGLDALRSGQETGTLQLTSGLRSQIRMLAQDSDDEVADAAEDLLALL